MQVREKYLYAQNISPSHKIRPPTPHVLGSLQTCIFLPSRGENYIMGLVCCCGSMVLTRCGHHAGCLQALICGDPSQSTPGLPSSVVCPNFKLFMWCIEHESIWKIGEVATNFLCGRGNLIPFVDEHIRIRYIENSRSSRTSTDLHLWRFDRVTKRRILRIQVQGEKVLLHGSHGGLRRTVRHDRFAMTVLRCRSRPTV
jgi:hypothetical protein